MLDYKGILAMAAKGQVSTPRNIVYGPETRFTYDGTSYVAL